MKIMLTSSATQSWFWLESYYFISPQTTRARERHDSAFVEMGPKLLVLVRSRSFTEAEQYDAEAHQIIRHYLEQEDEFPWGSACSGSDCPQWLMEFLSQLPFNRRRYTHLIPADIMSSKRAFIRKVHRPGPLHLYADIFDICLRGRVANLIKGKADEDVTSVCPADVAKHVQVWYIGFSCKTVSGLNASSPRSLNHKDARQGSTGITFSGTLVILQRPFEPGDKGRKETDRIGRRRPI